MTLILTTTRHAALISVLEDAQRRYEAEAASYASLGEIGRALAAERIERAKEAEELFGLIAAQ